MDIKKILAVFLIGFLTISSSQAQRLQFCLQSKKGDKHLRRSLKRVNEKVSEGRFSTRTKNILTLSSGRSPIRFHLRAVGGERGYYYIVTRLNSGGRIVSKYLCVHKNGEKKSEAELKSFENTEQYKWKFEPTGTGEYNIKNKLGNYLDVKWGNSNDGTPIWMWPKNGDDAQVFRIMPIRNGALSNRRAPLRSVIARRSNNTGNNGNANSNNNRNTTNRIIRNPKVKVSILNCQATHGDDGGSDRTFEFYTKIRVAKGMKWNPRTVDAYHYPKWNSSLFRAQPSGTNNRFKSYSYDKTLYNVDNNYGYFKVYISLWDYDEASGDDCFDISPRRGKNEEGLIISQKTGGIFFLDNNGHVVNIGRKGVPFTIEGTDYNNNDELTAKITLKIDWE